jgi:uncharacterized membrane protein
LRISPSRAVSSLGAAFLAGAIGWAVLLPLAAFATVRPPPGGMWYPLALVVYRVGRIVCHQRPERSFFLWAVQMPVCARCAGIYVGGAVGAIVAALTAVRAPLLLRRFGAWEMRRDGVAGRCTSPRVVLAVAAAPTVATWVLEWCWSVPTSNLVRALAGLPLGVVLVLLVYGASLAPGGAAGAVEGQT